MATFEDEVLVLWPTNGNVSGATIEQRVAATPGAFRDPHDPLTWLMSSHPQDIVSLHRERVEHPASYPLGLARVVVSPDHVVVYPDYSTGRARQFVTWLLSQSPCELNVRGETVGRVALPSDIYKDDTWEDPDASADPTETPPRTGTVVTVIHDRGGLLEHIDVHDSGVMSYEQIRPVRDPVKTYRRLPSELLERWLELVNGLPSKGDAPGPDGEYVDPVIVELDTPTEVVSAMKIDAARPTEPCREFMSLVNGWFAALREDRAAMPPGLFIYP